MKNKRKILSVWVCILLIHTGISLLIVDMISKQVVSETSIELSNGLIIAMSIPLLLLGSFLDVIIISLLINISTVILNISIKGVKAFFIASLFNLIINLYLLSTILITYINNTLSIDKLSQNVFLNPFFYAGIIFIGLYIYYFEGKKTYKVLIVLAAIVLYKVITATLTPDFIL